MRKNTENIKHNIKKALGDDEIEGVVRLFPARQRTVLREYLKSLRAENGTTPGSTISSEMPLVLSNQTIGRRGLVVLITALKKMKSQQCACNEPCRSCRKVTKPDSVRIKFTKGGEEHLEVDGRLAAVNDGVVPALVAKTGISVSTPEDLRAEINGIPD